MRIFEPQEYIFATNVLSGLKINVLFVQLHCVNLIKN